MKKLCFVTTISMTVRAFVLPVAEYFARHTDWQITIVCDDDPSLLSELPSGIRYIPIPMKRGISLSGIASAKKLYDLFRRESFDLVQYSTPNAAFYASIASWLAGIKHRKYHLMGFRYLGFSGIKKHIFKIIERVSCALSTDIECVSTSNMRFGIQDRIFPSRKAHVVFHGSSAGIDLARFDISKKADWRESTRKHFGFREDQCVFGFAGRITGDKGINELVHAFEKLSFEKNKLLLIGSIESDGLEASTLTKIEENPNITIHLFVTDIERYYAAMDVLVLPSYREGFGNIVIEAQAMGVPVIVTDIPGPIDAMDPGNTGLVVPKADTAALADAMLWLSSHHITRATYGNRGRKLVEDQFDSEKLCAHFLQERKALLCDRKPSRSH